MYYPSMSRPPSPNAVTLITGASSGFGLLTAVALASRGLRVFGSMRDPSRQGALKEAAARAGVTIPVVRLDVTDRASIDEAIRAIEAREGGVEVLVNNAGVGLIGSFEDTTEAELRSTFETNFFGAAAVMRAVIPGMRARGRGRIVNVSSVGGRLGTLCVSAYSASKFALEGMSEALSIELAPFGIEVVIVEPGAFRTAMIGPEKRQLTPLAADPSSPYYARCSALDAYMQKQFEGEGPDPAPVADTIVEAVTALHPKLRYPVGTDAHVLLRLKGMLPARAFERLFAAMFERVIMKP
jgi:NAD(P)-dependent dehydrogenase (short-subunit alcohol dehydrogenase family)